MPEHTPAPSPARSLYGFFMYLFSKTVLAVYMIWAVVPDEYLYYINIYYIPQKYWTTAVPIQCLVALTLFAFVIYPSANFMLTCAIDSKHTICDNFSSTGDQTIKCRDYVKPQCICKNDEKCMKNNYSATPEELDENAVPQLQDLDIRYICKKLYLNPNKKLI